MSDGEALLKAIHEKPREFAPRVIFRDWANENPDAIREWITAAMNAPGMELLTPDGIRQRKSRERVKSHLARVAAARATFPNRCSEFVDALAWLAAQGRRETVDREMDSLFYAVDAEESFDQAGYRSEISHGSFILAAIHLGIVWEWDPGNNTHTVCLGIVYPYRSDQA